jgi:hypothetical protein
VDPTGLQPQLIELKKCSFNTRYIYRNIPTAETIQITANNLDNNYQVSKEQKQELMILIKTVTE